MVLNDDKDLEKTIKSVLLQKYNNVEFIIIDGGSRGSTISKIKKYLIEILTKMLYQL